MRSLPAIAVALLIASLAAVPAQATFTPVSGSYLGADGAGRSVSMTMLRNEIRGFRVRGHDPVSGTRHGTTFDINQHGLHVRGEWNGPGYVSGTITTSHGSVRFGLQLQQRSTPQNPTE